MPRKLIGLTFAPRTIQAVELSTDGTTVETLKRADFEMPAVDKPLPAAEIGKKFAEFLKSNGFTARAACAGPPTQWLMLKEKTMPLVGAENLAGILSLQAERDFSIEPDQLVLDYTSATQTSPDGKAALSVLLAAALRERVDFCRNVAAAAGLTLRFIASTTIELARRSELAAAYLSVGPAGADLTIRNRGGLCVPAVLSSIPPPKDAVAWATSVGVEARRVLALRAGMDAADLNTQTPVLFLNSGAALDDAAQRALSDSLGRALVFTGTGSAASALGTFGLSAEKPALNFLDSKLVEKKAGAFAGVKGWMAAAAFIGIGLLGAMIYSWFSGSRELSTLKQQAAARKVEVDAAKAFLARYDSAQGWYDKRPNMLDCMSELTRVIPLEDGDSRAIAWISNLTMKEDYHCTVAMKAVDTRAYFKVFEAIEQNDAFREVKLLYMTQPDKKKSEVSFAVNFVYWKPK